MSAACGTALLAAPARRNSTRQAQQNLHLYKVNVMCFIVGGIAIGKERNRTDG